MQKFERKDERYKLRRIEIKKVGRYSNSLGSWIWEAWVPKYSFEYILPSLESFSNLPAIYIERNLH